MGRHVRTRHQLKIAGCSITRWARILDGSPHLQRESNRREPSVPEHSKLIERVIVGLVACSISVNLLATELPRVMPYLVILVVIFVVVRLVLFHTRKW